MFWIFGTKKKTKKKPALKVSPATPDTGKDWKSVAERWQKKNQSLQGELEKIKMEQGKVQQLIDEHKSQAKELAEKLALEKGWREKEQESLEKSRKYEKDLKDQVHRTENDLEKERSHRLRLEGELRYLKTMHEEILEEKRLLSIKAASQQTTLESNAREIRELKSENVRLKVKHEDVQWVAKSEFDKLKKQLQQPHG